MAQDITFTEFLHMDRRNDKAGTSKSAGFRLSQARGPLGRVAAAPWVCFRPTHSLPILAGHCSDHQA